VLRRKQPETPRPFRAWGHPFTTGLALLASVVFLGGMVVSDLRGSLWTLGLLALSVPLFYLLRRNRTA
jgi:APA family basic amino acid/polyamine antiporter